MTVQAAPNQCTLVANIKRIEPAPGIPDKAELELEIIDAQDVEGLPNFGKHHIGAIVSANTLEDVSSLTTGIRIRCTSEYLGGPFGGGVFHLTAIHPDSE